MSIEADAAPEEHARELGAAILDTPEYRRYLEKMEAVEADEEAQRKVGEFERLRDEFVLARQTGDVSDADLRELQQAQAELESVPVMAEFLEARAELEGRLQGLNELISDPLALDFGEKAGGCCQD